MSFWEELSALPGGQNVKSCIQCGTCTGACPNASEMDYPPRKLIALLRAGMQDEVLSSNSMWYCASCYLCTVRCPRGIKPTDLMHALECLAIRHGVATKRTGIPVMYQAFVDNVKDNGRVHELSFMLRYYLRDAKSYLPTRTSPLKPFTAFKLLGMMPIGWGLLLRGRMPLKARKIRGSKDLKAIVEKAESMGGAS